MVKPYEALYTVKEAAKVLKVNPNTVYSFLNSGQLPYLLLGSKKIRGCDLEEFINKYPAADIMNGGEEENGRQAENMRFAAAGTAGNE